jgi:hypothetical protein
MENTGFGGDVEAATEKQVKQSTAAQSPDSKKATRRASKRTAPTKAEAFEILTSALEICRQAGIEFHFGNMPDRPGLVGAGFYKARVVTENNISRIEAIEDGAQ